MTRLYCATGNAGKLREFRLAADTARVEIELLPAYKSLPEAVEDGATFEENAIKKALHYAPHATGLLFADDSGLEVDALGGAPGVYSARFSGPHATDDSNNRLLLERLAGHANRKARFVCAIALVEGEQRARRLSRSRGRARSSTRRAARAASATTRSSTAPLLAARSARQHRNRNSR